MSDPFLEADLIPICRVPDCGRIEYSATTRLCRWHYQHGVAEPSPQRVGGIETGTLLPTGHVRLFGVIATYGDGSTWTIKDVKARNDDQAVDYFNRVLPDSRVIAVGLLGGSGHALKWMTRAIPLPRFDL